MTPWIVWLSACCRHVLGKDSAFQLVLVQRHQWVLAMQTGAVALALKGGFKANGIWVWMLFLWTWMKWVKFGGKCGWVYLFELLILKILHQSQVQTLFFLCMRFFKADLPVQTCLRFFDGVHPLKHPSVHSTAGSIFFLNWISFLQPPWEYSLVVASLMTPWRIDDGEILYCNV